MNDEPEPPDATIPHDLDAERAAVGIGMLSPAGHDLFVDHVRPGDLYGPDLRALGEILHRAHHEGWTPCPVTAWDAIREAHLEELFGHNPSTLVSILASAPATTTLPRLGQIIRDYAWRRALLEISDDMIDAVYANGRPDEILAMARKRLAKINTEAEWAAT